jgi:hypothetical protein
MDIGEAASPLSISVPIVVAILSLLANSILQRYADVRKFNDELRRNDIKMEHEKKVLRAIIRAELKSIINTYEAEVMFACGHEFTFVPAGFFESFGERAANIGLLTSAEAEAVMDAYYTYRQKIGYVARNGIKEKESPKPRDTIPYELTAEKKTWLINDLTEVIKSAKDAIAVMEDAARSNQLDVVFHAR